MAEKLFDGSVLKSALLGAELSLEAHIEELNLLNVFPVPDGDTGVNMFSTMQAANKAATNITSNSAADVSRVIARGALLGASGNSGVILSQILRGIAKGLELKESFSCVHFAQSLRAAAEMACRAVNNPVEGTIITVSREAADVAVRMAEEGASLEQTLEAVAAQARETVDKTPEMLPQLKEAGVVDAGGKGLQYIFEGMRNCVSKRIARPVEQEEVSVSPRAELISHGYGYDFQFLIRGHNLPVAKVRSRIEKMGESAIIVGDDGIIRVHIHTHQPDAIMEYARSVGEVTDIVRESLDEQVRDFRSRHGRVPDSV
ncbi:MAG TPA: DAK2 domain-containing protein [Dehalococcoidia bacterium]|nr:DAK2 domain-containing protein [Dehalococcoidia bacterium]